MTVFFLPTGEFLNDKGAFLTSEFTPVVHKSEILEKQVFCTEVAGIAIALCQVNGNIYAVANRCSHAHSSFAGGRLRAYRITCPLHGATFDIRTGDATGLPAKRPIVTYPTRVSEDGMVEVGIGDRQ